MVFKRESLSKWPSREQSGGQKKRGRHTRTGIETKEWKDRQRQVEKIGETSGSKSVRAEIGQPGSLSCLAVLQPSVPALLHVAPGRAQGLNSPQVGLDSGTTPTTVLLLAWPNRRVPAGAQSEPRGEGALFS